MKVATPDIPHMREYAEKVYEPSEDTFLMLDALEGEISRWKDEASGGTLKFLEVGCGSGCISAFVAIGLRQAAAMGEAARALELWAVDINPNAVECTEKTLHVHGVGESERMLLSGDYATHPQLTGATDFSVVVFNPPYVVTEDAEYEQPPEQDWLTKAWAGGERGRREIDRFLNWLPRHLHRNGCAYLLVIEENDIADIREQIRSHHLHMEVLRKRICRNEKQAILKISYCVVVS